MRHTLLTTAALLPLLLAACTGGGGAPAPTPGPTPNPTPAPGPGSALTTRLAACPQVMNSSDPAATACLAGTYSGKTLANAACTVTIRADGSYDFDTPTLKYTHAPAASAIRIFTHQVSVGPTHTLIWLMSDSASANPAYEMDFKAQFGTYAQPPQVTIEGTQRIGNAQTSASCVLPL
ncbi:hypothetical protein [Deinococcus multiflagellatus]|uniref:Lipoprotein n=1 Tax=Deinococcus multiflagellatus TaxID=1656887 RepID=A0ABW1ZI47_9DEIO|nr:hypothetical protein [Deinococcus multiflagellatus]MBZ9712967.1 hypothetical protein [Deinococcus multiflagellatus]